MKAWIVGTYGNETDGPYGIDDTWFIAAAPTRLAAESIGARLFEIEGWGQVDFICEIGETEADEGAITVAKALSLYPHGLRTWNRNGSDWTFEDGRETLRKRNAGARKIEAAFLEVFGP